MIRNLETNNSLFDSSEFAQTLLDNSIEYLKCVEDIELAISMIVSYFLIIIDMEIDNIEEWNFEDLFLHMVKYLDIENDEEVSFNVDTAVSKKMQIQSIDTYNTQIILTKLQAILMNASVDEIVELAAKAIKITTLNESTLDLVASVAVALEKQTSADIQYSVSMASLFLKAAKVGDIDGFSDLDVSAQFVSLKNMLSNISLENNSNMSLAYFKDIYGDFSLENTIVVDMTLFVYYKLLVYQTSTLLDMSTATLGDLSYGAT